MHTWAPAWSPAKQHLGTCREPSPAIAKILKGVHPDHRVCNPAMAGTCKTCCQAIVNTCMESSPAVVGTCKACSPAIAGTCMEPRQSIARILQGVQPSHSCHLQGVQSSHDWHLLNVQLSFYSLYVVCNESCWERWDDKSNDSRKGVSLFPLRRRLSAPDGKRLLVSPAMKI
jgi:hypothetical protein